MNIKVDPKFVRKEIYLFIQGYTSEHGRPPTIREIRDKLLRDRIGSNSTSVVKRHIEALNAEGYIEHEPYTSRGIKVLHGGIPVRGTIAAGQPLTILEDAQEMLDMNLQTLKKEAFVLKVSGQSMVDAKIFNGDYIVVEPETYVTEGAIVVATNLRDGTATVKRLYKENLRARLQPANETIKMKPIYVTADEWNHGEETFWEIQGTVKAVIRLL